MTANLQELHGQVAASWKRCISFAAVYSISLINVVAFVSVVPTASEYMQSVGGSKDLAGILVGLQPITQGFMNIPLTALLRKTSLKNVLLLACAMWGIGSIVYALADTASSAVMLFAGRMIIGSIGGPQLGSTYVARAYDVDSRSSAMVIMTSSTALGFAVGPGIAFLLAEAFNHLPQNSVFNKMTAPALIVALISACLFVFTSLNFEEPPEFGAKSVDQGTEKHFPWVGLAVAFFATLTFSIGFGVWEVQCSVLAETDWGWSVSTTALYLALVMLVLTPISLGMAMWEQRWQRRQQQQKRSSTDRVFILALGCLAFAGSIFFLASGLQPHRFTTARIAIFTVGSVITLASLQCERGFVTSVVTKMTSPGAKPIVIGVYSCLVSVGRGVGGALGSILTEDSFAYVFVSMLAVQAILVSLGYRFLVDLERALPPLPR